MLPLMNCNPRKPNFVIFLVDWMQGYAAKKDVVVAICSDERELSD
jgi:hypothetical protein